MSGLWDIIGIRNENAEHLAIALLRTELVGVALSVQTRTNARDHIEDWFGRVLNSGEMVDLNAIADNYETGTVEDRLVYDKKVELALNGAELTLINETQFRNILDIS